MSNRAVCICNSFVIHFLGTNFTSAGFHYHPCGGSCISCQRDSLSKNVEVDVMLVVSVGL